MAISSRPAPHCFCFASGHTQMRNQSFIISGSHFGFVLRKMPYPSLDSLAFFLVDNNKKQRPAQRPTRRGHVDSFSVCHKRQTPFPKPGAELYIPNDMIERLVWWSTPLDALTMRNSRQTQACAPKFAHLILIPFLTVWLQTGARDR